ncbi:hypothetical protein [Sulfitobacter geojensis]|nr:hypothetical protein [Sulfitobacter geojensis]KHA52656.1 hypothetical protein Z947_2966 [Sulfitobacter geojensis]NYI28670.1 hypothetical protein [Sulfitobacter geojensis]
MFVAFTVILSSLIIANVGFRAYAEHSAAQVQARIKRSIDRGHRT